MFFSFFFFFCFLFLFFSSETLEPWDSMAFDIGLHFSCVFESWTLSFLYRRYSRGFFFISNLIFTEKQIYLRRRIKQVIWEKENLGEFSYYSVIL